MKKIRVLIVDDHPVFREGLSRVLTEHGDIVVVAQAGDAEEALELANKTIPDVAIVDIALPKTDGTEFTRQIKAVLPTVAVLIVSAYDYEAYVISSLRAGATGYLLKGACPREIINAVLSVHAGESVFELKAVSGVLNRLSIDPANLKGINQLSQRELDILKLTAGGMTNKEIATQLFISERTVQTHMFHIYRKLEVKSRTEAVLHALHGGWLTLNDLNRGQPNGHIPEAT